MFNELRDRYLRTKLEKDEKFASFLFSIEGIIILVLIANIIYLNIYIFHNKSTTKFSDNTTEQSPTVTIFPTPTTSPDPSATTIPTKQSSVLSPQNTAKDYFIPLGSGTNQTSDWADVPGVQTTIDFGNYSNIKAVHFEASVYVPTANQWVSVRLYNVTDKHPVWFSEITMDGNASAYLTSPAIAYDAGPKVYQVQMKTQLQAPTNLVQSKIHVILQ